jgi:amidase
VICAASPVGEGTRVVSRLARCIAVVAIAVGMASMSANARTVTLDEATIADLNVAFDAGTLTAERLVELSLARIAAYDRQGPQLRAVLVLNPQALETARALDIERKERGRRSPLHGIPVVLKDNIDTRDMPTTGGSLLLEGSMPPDDAFVVKRLRDAGAIIFAKVNLSEFATGGCNSSLGGQSKNPHDLAHTPSGSSCGTGVAIAAGYATVGLGTDTAASIRAPSSANGIVGLKPSYGLISRDGIIPLALSLDMSGPMTRSVYDAAAALSVMTGIDPADPASARSQGRIEKDYTKFLKADALKGARIGLARDFMNQDSEVDWTIQSALEIMKQQGATVVDVEFPQWFLGAKGDFFSIVQKAEFVQQVGEYLSTTGPTYPKSAAELLTRSYSINAPRADGAGPNPSRWSLFQSELAAPTVDDYRYLAIRDHALPLVRAMLEGMFAAHKLDAIVYPTLPRRPGLLGVPVVASSGANAADVPNLAGFLELVVPAGFTADDLPVGISFLGTAFSEPKILALGYSFEQASHARRTPVHAPVLAGERIEVPDGR